MARDEQWSLSTQLTLTALPTAVPCARLHAKEVVWEWRLGVLAETTELLVSELVTNAVKATQAVDLGGLRAGRMISVPYVSLRLSSDRVRVLVEVWDANPRPPAPASPDPEKENGRGLLLVETLSDRWGYYQPHETLAPAQAQIRRQPAAAPAYPPNRRGAGKVVWCEIVRDPQPKTLGHLLREIC